MRLILNILLIIVIVSTLCICVIKPDMHKNILVFDSAYKIAPEEEVAVKNEIIPIMEQPTQPKPTVKLVEKKVVMPKVETKIRPKQTVKSTQTTTLLPKQTTVAQTKTVTPKSLVKQETKTVTPTPVVKEETKTVIPKAETVVKQETVKPVQTVKEIVTVTPPPKVLTPQEEVVVWNEWRSRLQNKVMQDVKLPLMPTGTIFKFSFSVDKYGKVSNLQTWAEPSSYTPYAIQYIAPVIRSYQGREILKFPSGSSRVTTDVKGGWKISDNEKYSTSDNYNDIERIRN